MSGRYTREGAARRTAAAELPTQAELAAFARAAARMLVTSSPRLGEARAARRERGAGLSFLEHRDYQPGDDVRRISWPLTLKWRRPVLRELEKERRADWLICVDASSSMGTVHEGKWRYAVRLAAGVSYALLELGHRVAAALFTDTVIGACPPGRGASQYLRIGALLCGARPARSGARTQIGACVPRLAGASSAVIVSDFLTVEAPRADLAAFAARCSDTHAIQVNDRRELELPSARTLELIDIETGEQMTWTGGRRSTETAARAAAERTRAIALACAAAAIRFSAAELATPWQHTLLRHLAGGSSRRAGCSLD